jgi:hypothetical protein
MMEDVVHFIQNYVCHEYEVMIQIRTEADVDRLTTNLNNLNQFFRGLNSGLHVSSSRKIENRNDVIEQLQPRVLFKVEQYNHPTLGQLFRVYVSSPFQGDNSYFTNFFVADTDDGLKIIARYTLCEYCKGIGSKTGFPCDECRGLGWNWRGGVRLEILGDLIASKQLSSPTS